MLPEDGLASPSSLLPDNFHPLQGTLIPLAITQLELLPAALTRAVPTFITSSVLSPPPSLLELLGLAVPLASLGGS